VNAEEETQMFGANGFALHEAGGMVIVPGSRYTSRDFFDLEMERLWPRVWQIACREEEIPNPGDFLEYMIGDQSVLVVRQDVDTITAFFNTCMHRGTRLAAGVGNFATSEIRCRYHAWRWDLAGDIIEVVDRHEYPATMTDDDVHLGEVQVGRWGGFVFVNMDRDCESFESFLGDVPEQFASYRFDDLRFRSYRTIIFEANWKTCIDSFQEGYHPQGLHPQMLTWFDDTRMVYRQVGQHSRYDAPRRREMGPSPRLGLGPDDYDEQELLANRVDAMAGLFSRKDQKLLEELKTNGPPPGKTALEVFDELRLNAMRERGYDLSGLDPDDVLSNGTIHIFPNLVGPITHGNVTLYRARPNGLDPDSTILDYWALEWLPDGADAPPVERKFYDDWSTKNWGLINNQDFANFVEVTRGIKSRGYRGARLNPVQEANIIHHEQVLDRYLAN
jgi:phenylpropionate dioxygenase-like ring-hydroxylating dioxygenase large terminal subunit